MGEQNPMTSDTAVGEVLKIRIQLHIDEMFIIQHELLLISCKFSDEKQCFFL